MTKILLMLSPVGALALFAGLRYLMGRPIRRRDLNIISSILLLGYFLTTAGLGIFWVANQELPVFDLHYLFGYITLTAVCVHLAFNWQKITAFLRRGAPSYATVSGGRKWMPVVRAGGWALGLALYAGVFFWIGLRQGSSRVEIIQAVSVDKPSEPIPSAPSSSAPKPAKVKRREINAVLKPRPVQRQMVRADGREMPLAIYYHEQTKHSRASVMRKSSGLDWSTRPSVFKEYPENQKVDLPHEFVESAVSTGDAINIRRRHEYSSTPETMTAADLSTLLHMTNGITAAKKYPGMTYYLRAAPSAGALYPVVTYVLVNRVDGIAPGLYHFSVRDHALYRLRDGEELLQELSQSSSSPRLLANARVVFLFSAIYYRSSWKYGDRAYRYCLLDAGHVAENLMLALAALGYDSVPIGRFDDRGVNRFLGLDEREEGALLIVPIGDFFETSPSSLGVPFAASPELIDGNSNPLLLLAHGQTCLRRDRDYSVARFPVRAPVNKPYASLPIVDLPDDFPRGAPLFSTIQRRRSARNWLKKGMTFEQLSSVLYYTFGIDDPTDGRFTDPSVESTNLIHLYLIVNNVQGLDRGLYYYRREDHSLSLLQAGNFRHQSYAISLFQEVVGKSGVAVIMTIDVESLGYPDGDRGYRYATMDAGMIGGRLYLQTVALGLGCTGIGAFFDDEVSELIGVDPNDELVIYMAAIGTKAPE